jgi:uracil-DNA glycosylase
LILLDISFAMAWLQAMDKYKPAPADPNLSLPELRKKAKGCTACPLYKRGKQTVFGSGPDNAKIMIVGEQPGAQEDEKGLPFVGPAGRVLDKALVQAGLSRAAVYLTNAVKHFKWTRAGKIRLHQKPSSGEMHACLPWLQAEIARIKPAVIIALGATAGTALLGRLPKITKERGKVITESPQGQAVIVTWHPSVILRSRDKKVAEQRAGELAADLKLAFNYAKEMQKK